MAQSVFFAFDLDGTVTREELLPAIAREAGVFKEIARITVRTLNGDLCFAPSFRRRFELLRHVPLDVVRRMAAAVPLDPHIAAFIAENRPACAIVTGNLDCWIEPILARLGCAAYCSRSAWRDGELALASILDKKQAIRAIAATGKRVVAIGDAANDIPMFQEAMAGIAYGGIRNPPPALLAVAARVAYDGVTLCRLLRNIRDTEVFPRKHAQLSTRP